MRRLLIDTAGHDPLVALADGDRVAALVAVADKRRLSEDLVPAIAAVLDRAGVTAADCGGAVVTLGPGSFTGVRAGLAAVTGLAAPFAWPVVGIDRFQLFHEVFAAEAGADRPAVSILLDSGRDSLFVLDVPAGGPLPPPQQARSVGIDALRERLVGAADRTDPPGATVSAFLGDGLARLPEIAGTVDVTAAARAAALARLGRRLPPGPPGLVPPPIYLRGPDAVPAPPPPVIHGTPPP